MPALPRAPRPCPAAFAIVGEAVYFTDKWIGKKQRRQFAPLSSGLEVFQRVNLAAVLQHFEVDMGSGRTARAAHRGD